MKGKLLTIGVSLALISTVAFYQFNKQEGSFERDALVNNQWEIENHTASQKQFKVSGIHSQQYLLKELSSNQVLVSRKEDKKTEIASLTKIMTAYILLDKAENLNAVVSIDGAIIDELSAEGASLSGFGRDEEVTIKDLAYGIMLPSGGDASIVAANFIAGSEKEFAKLMNQYGQQLGLKNTHFSNATGLDALNHYSTVADLAVLLEQALKNEAFYEVFTTLEYTTDAKRYEPEGYYIKSTLLREGNHLALKEGKILGGKTGYTQKAGLCLASIAEVNGKVYLLVSTGADGNPLTEQYNVTDAVTMYNTISQVSSI